MTRLAATAVPGVEKLWAALPEARIVGGAVRDGLAGREIADVDFASPLAPDAVMARLARAGIKAVPTGIAHGTVTAVTGGRGFEITTLRRDVETDGRHAVVAFTDDWREDAARRDFTINAMSASQDGTLFDYFGGVADLHAGLVRFVGEAERRITEDHLRILRFFRFHARYAKGEPDPQAIGAITRLREGVRQLSAERVWSELKRILLAPDPRISIRLMQDCGVLARVIPEGADIAALGGLIARGAPADPMLRIAALLAGDAEGFGLRLRLSREEQEILRACRSPGVLRPDSDDADLRRALAEASPEILIARSWLAQDGTPGWDALRQRLAGMQRPVFPLQGRDIVALGIPAGPEVGAILERVRAWWMQGGCTADAAACRAKAREQAG